MQYYTEYCHIFKAYKIILKSKFTLFSDYTFLYELV